MPARHAVVSKNLDSSLPGNPLALRRSTVRIRVLACGFPRVGVQKP
jgi:hypothetical protein